MRNLHRVSLLLALGTALGFAGCHTRPSPPEPLPTPTNGSTPAPTASPPCPVTRVSPDYIRSVQVPIFVGPFPVAPGVKVERVVYAPARALAAQLDALSPRGQSFPVVWSFTQRTISVGGHVFDGGVLVNRTGYIASDETARAFDLTATQGANGLHFEPLATLGGKREAAHVYRDPIYLWNSNNGKENHP